LVYIHICNALMMRKYREVQRCKCNAACNRPKGSRGSREGVGQIRLGRYIAGNIVVIRYWEFSIGGWSKVKIGYARSGREKGGDGGLGRLAVCSF